LRSTSSSHTTQNEAVVVEAVQRLVHLLQHVALGVGG
jgi:hypothetical protein